ncbi:RluA family pseudouridine synthase [Candidatus Gracilibacteria bacterium]|nr:RluA family pseudouridine synthase [Candidatus Gracilibacteria bacterium]
MQNIQFSVYIDTQDKRRLNLYLSHVFPYFSHLYINELIENGKVRVNGKSIHEGDRLRLRDLIEIECTTDKYYLDGENMPLEVISDNSDFIVISKDALINTHTFPGIYGKTGTLLNAILYHYGKECNINGIERPGIIHRLDRDTSGLIIIAKNGRSMQPLQEKIAKKEIRKLYYAVVVGLVSKTEGIIESYIGNDPSDYKKMTTRDPTDPKLARTKYRLISHIDNQYSLLEIELFTGRTHQIRVHMADMGNPIIGDKVYGNPDINLEVFEKYGLSRQWLHARELMFTLFGVDYHFVAPLKDDLRFILAENGIVIV